MIGKARDPDDSSYYVHPRALNVRSNSFLGLEITLKKGSNHPSSGAISVGKAKKVMVEKTLVEIIKKPNTHERKRVVDGMSGLNLTDASIGGVWTDRKRKVPCPECHGHHTKVYLSFYDVEFSGFSGAGGEIEGLGNLTISCMDCKKDFNYDSCHSVPFDFVESATFEEVKQFRKQYDDVQKQPLGQAPPRKNIGEV
jgi:hypothetical protein